MWGHPWVDTFGRSPVIVPLDLPEDQFQIYNKISRNYEYSFLFESLTGPEVLAETSVMGFDPERVIRGYADRVEIQERDGSVRIEATDDPFGEIKKRLDLPAGRSYRYLGGAVGVVNYDAAGLLEDVSDDGTAKGPLMEFGMYDDGIIYDRKLRKPFYFYHKRNRFEELKISDGTFGRVDVSEARAETGEAEFSRMVDKAKRYVYDGDVFQVVLSRRFSFDVAGDHLAIYRQLRRLNPSPYMYHLRHGEQTIIGASPEMLIRVTDGRAETFPIAGTRKVTGDEQSDTRLASELLHDEKELAEHTMLVDLGRNDLGRVCRYGTVRAEELMKVRRFSHVQHIVTHLSGMLDNSHDMVDAFRALFPAGTVSGAPKVRAMQVISELESAPRGAYAGAVGYFSYNNCCDFAIAIRSIFIRGGSGFVQAGAGIVSDSVPEAEFQETQDKAQAMLQALREASS